MQACRNGQDENGEIYLLTSAQTVGGETGAVWRISSAEDENPVPVMHMVSLSGFTFTPDTTVVNPGDIVRWNLVSGLHSAVSGEVVGGSPVPDGKFSSGSLVPAPHTFDVVFDYAFLTAHPPAADGLYPYYCSVHYGDGMVARIIAKPILSNQRGFKLDTFLNNP